MIWTHGSEELEQSTTRDNSTHPSMKFTSEIYTLVYLSWMYLLVSLKKILKHRYTENQPIALPGLCIVVSILITPIVISQLLILKRICSDIFVFEHEVKILTQSLFI